MVNKSFKPMEYCLQKATICLHRIICLFIKELTRWKQKFWQNGMVYLVGSFCTWSWSLQTVSLNSLELEWKFYLTLFIPDFFGWCSTWGGGGGGVPPTPCDSFVFKNRQLKFYTQLLWGRINILRQQKLRSNQ